MVAERYRYLHNNDDKHLHNIMIIIRLTCVLSRSRSTNMGFCERDRLSKAESCCALCCLCLLSSSSSHASPGEVNKSYQSDLKDEEKENENEQQ